MTDRPRVLSGIQPTSESFHFGNYLGALRQWVLLQDTHDAFYCVVDLHAITAEFPTPEQMRMRTRYAAAQLLAVGLDPARCTLFVQSHVPEHTELGWIFSCLTGMGEASRMTQFKDKASKQQNVGVGFFSYPMLQAADIALYRAASVPVGEDQRQHLELTRDLVQRFNSRFGETLTVPEAHIVKATGKILDLQDPTAKMSKSAESQAGVLDLLDDPKVLTKKIKSAVTDTGREVRADPVDKPGITNLLTIFATVSGRSVAELEAAYEGKGYGDFKTDVAEAVVQFVTPIQERFARYFNDTEALDAVLADGAARARSVAEQTMDTVRERIGFLAAKH